MFPMRISSLVILILLSLLAVSCAQPKRSGIKYTKISAEEIQYIMDHQEISCAGIDGNSCPEGVVRVLTINQQQSEKSTVCSGFMVGKNRMVTNHHCVSTAAQCNDTYLAIYDGHDYFQTKCKRLIKAEEDYANERDSRRQIDYAVLELEDDFSGNTFDLASNKAIAGENVTAWVIDHIGLDRLDKDDRNPYEARVTEFQCSVANQNEVESLVLLNCPIIHGNSGSPVVNSAGQIIGIIWGGTNVEINSNTALSQRRALSAEGLVTEMIHFSEFVKI